MLKIKALNKKNKNEEIGIIFNIQRFSVHDGPGIRTLIFLKGCPLRCLWCDNPESQLMTPEITYTREKCIGCGRCLEVCPTKAITSSEKEGRIIDRSICDSCGKCAEVCFAEALQMQGKSMTVTEVMTEVRKDRAFYANSGGGITLSGGEPLSQPNFAERILENCQQEQIHTAIETCGYAEWAVLRKVIRHTDLVLFDVKHMDSIKHKEYTGVSNELILDNAKQVVQENIPLVIRIPVVPTYNDSEENIRASAEFAQKLGVEIHLLPYHRLGAAKYKRLGRKYTLRDVSVLNDEHLQEIKCKVESYGLRIQVGG